MRHLWSDLISNLNLVPDLSGVEVGHIYVTTS